MTEILAAIFACIGAGFMLVAAIGVAIFTDTFIRLHCAGKSATLGVACMLIAAALWSGDAGVTVRCVLAALFFLLTGPIGCHALARAVWRTQQKPNSQT
jgi:multicomponent Na+:H+ antiporter subunit G